MTTSSPTARDGRDAAASLLSSVGHLDPDVCDPGVRIHCLAATDQLQAAGAALAHVDVDPDAIAATIRAAMAHLGRLPAPVFATAAVLAAADAAQIALERYEDTRDDP